MSPDPEADVARLRAIAFAFPRTAEKLSHGMPVFFVEKGKTFAWYTHDHHRDGRSAVLVKTSGADEQDMLVARDADLFFRPAYMAHAGWIAIRTDLPATDWELIATRVAQSWHMIAPKKLVETL
ncbi:MmcQ/YjbR family DNA-binding protein [Sphingomonas nostoxanthinifaciens]|uniref:MmcQ/YjbR family DNA-binding protein n=1 Tax=Sphingomonas nostoxanthinifaciens TaxID=2872652 RepID=UPI002953EDD3|nr:MmcQ/YjbR family DNA-binding protein [Sphingomonas nostoxanthinifaciens]